MTAEHARPVMHRFARTSWLAHAFRWALSSRAATIHEALTFREWLRRRDDPGDADLATLWEEWADGREGDRG